MLPVPEYHWALPWNACRNNLHKFAWEHFTLASRLAISKERTRVLDWQNSLRLSDISGGTPLCGTPLCGTPLCGTPLCGTPLCGTP